MGSRHESDLCPAITSSGSSVASSGFGQTLILIRQAVSLQRLCFGLSLLNCAGFLPVKSLLPKYLFNTGQRQKKRFQDNLSQKPFCDYSQIYIEVRFFDLRQLTAKLSPKSQTLLLTAFRIRIKCCQTSSGSLLKIPFSPTDSAPSATRVLVHSPFS